MQVDISRFYIYSAVCGAILTAVALCSRRAAHRPAGRVLVAAFGLPRWFIAFRRGRRVKAFLNEFPNALDVIVRAVKSGLPLNDGIRLIAIGSAGTGQDRVPAHRRGAADGLVAFPKRRCA